MNNVGNSRQPLRNPLPRQSVLFLLIAWLSMFVLTSLAMAGGLEDARRRGKLLVGVKPDFPPFGYLDASGSIRGIDIEIARYLAKAVRGDETEALELVPVTSGSRIPFLYSDWIDVIVASMTITEDRRKVLEFSKPYFLSGSLLLVPKDSSVKDTGDLAGKTVAVIEGSIQEKDILEVAGQAKVIRFSHMPEALRAIREKRVDALCQDDVVVVALARENPDLKTAGKPFDVRPYAIAVKKGDMEFVHWIDAQLDRMKEDGSYEKIIRTYVGESESGLFKP